ncbi:MAG: hypothetical protein NTV06_05330 [candidate division Zixibacteria bacterium]|nr:hypothetical protein [candidate division Zixibacteria bacterium]
MARKKDLALKFLFIPAVILLVLGGCGRDNTVSIRKFPYPYKAALAICSDIDETETIKESLTIQEFLNTSHSTRFGQGLNLEIGNSFWFYNQCLDIDGGTFIDSLTLATKFTGGLDFGISIFKGTSDSLSDYTPLLLRLIKAGYIDGLHSYGNFTEHQFQRALAERALAFLKKDSLTIETFINHGGYENTQNIGKAPWFYGDNSGALEYHTDLTIPAGIKFLWRGQVTHCIGQDALFSPVNLIKQSYEYLQDQLHTKQQYPHDNKLVHIYQLDDGQKIFEFARFISPWGKYPEADENHLADQLGSSQINQLISNQGYMILYTHFGKGNGTEFLSPSTIAALRYIKKRNDDSSLMVTTTTKLLNYYIHSKYLYWHTVEKPDSVIIMIDSIVNEIEGKLLPDADDLEGLTFYIPDNKAIAIKESGRFLQYIANAADGTGRKSISLPWRHLQFPADISLSR